MKNALITGITGQDGTLLTQLLIQKGYRVVGISRAQPTSKVWRSLLEKDVKIIAEDITKKGLIENILLGEKFTEVYNLASFNSVQKSYENPVLVQRVNVDSINRIISSLIIAGETKTRLFNASSSEIFSLDATEPLNEKSQMNPSSPYGQTKMLAQKEVQSVREKKGLYAVNGVLFNHESEYRQERFFSKKVINGLVDVYTGERATLELETLESFRDWGYAKDYVEGIWRSLQSEIPEDYVFATGELHSAREFVKIGIEYLSLGCEPEEIIHLSNHSNRLPDSRKMTGDSKKAYDLLDWRHSLNFSSMISYLIDVEIESRNLNQN